MISSAPSWFTYHRVWWPRFDRLMYPVDRSPVRDEAEQSFVDPSTGDAGQDREERRRRTRARGGPGDRGVGPVEDRILRSIRNRQRAQSTLTGVGSRLPGRGGDRPLCPSCSPVGPRVVPVPPALTESLTNHRNSLVTDPSEALP